MTDQAPAQPGDQNAPARPHRNRWTGLVGFNLLSAIVLAFIGYAVGEWIGGRIGAHVDFVAATDQNDVALLLGYVFAVIGWLIGLGFLNYPVGAHARSLDRPARARGDRDRPLLPPHDRPQGRRPAVLRRHRLLLLRRRPQRDADSRRAAEPRFEALPARPVPHDRLAARHDDDHDDVVGHPGPVWQLPRAAHDRRQGHGLPPHRGTDILAASDGRA